MKSTHLRAALVFVLLFAVMMTSAALAVDTDAACSLTVEYGVNTYREDMELAGVVFDLYRIASVSDGYDYSFLPPYEELSVGYDVDSAAWKELAQSAAVIALESDRPAVSGAAAGNTVTKTDAGESLAVGLYLLVAHGAELEDYTTTAVDEAGNEILATYANSPRYEYAFAPELVAIPGKASADDGPANTADPGEWQYDVAATLKPSRSNRYGTLELTKTLLSYETSEPAAFVFTIEAVLDGENVFSDAAALTFNGTGTQTLRYDRIPAGSLVTVTEVYSGARYSLTTPRVGTAEITAEEIARVSFTNDYDGGGRGGHGIVNRFTNDGVTWNWQSQ